MEDNFSMDGDGWDGFRIIQVRYIQAHLLLYSPDWYWSVAWRLGTPVL